MNDSERSELLSQLVQLTSDVNNRHIEPSKQQFETLLGLENDGPWHFVNLLSFHDSAQYPAGHERAGQGLTGQQAYDEYGKVAHKHVLQRGGELVSLNAVHAGIIGGDGGWERLATMKYPTIAAFLDMVQDTDYRAALIHREAGLKATMLLATQSLI
jgi:uncharacterized protein (DUF1330 family)